MTIIANVHHITSQGSAFARTEKGASIFIGKATLDKSGIKVQDGDLILVYSYGSNKYDRQQNSKLKSDFRAHNVGKTDANLVETYIAQKVLEIYDPSGEWKSDDEAIPDMKLAIAGAIEMHKKFNTFNTMEEEKNG